MFTAITAIKHLGDASLLMQVCEASEDGDARIVCG